MSQNPKINLSAIKNKTKSVDTKSEIVESLEEAIVEDNQNIIVETPVEEKKEVVSMVPKITLLSIKTNKSPLEIEEENEEKIEIEHEEKKEELTETLELIDEKNNEVSKEENLTDVILPEDKNIIDGSGKNMIKINEIINSKTDKNNIIDDIQEGRKNEEINKGANNEDIETTINNKKNKDEVEEIERKINEKVEEEINKKKPKLKTLSSEESDEKIGDKKTELF